jgi:hypothetical protein
MPQGGNGASTNEGGEPGMVGSGGTPEDPGSWDDSNWDEAVWQ